MELKDMRVFKYKRERTVGTHNFDLFQLYVCMLNDTKGNAGIGVTILPVNGIAEIPFILTVEKARELSKVLSDSASLVLPQSFYRGSGMLTKFFGLHVAFLNAKNGNLHGRLIPGIHAPGQYINVSASSLLCCSNSLLELTENV